VCIFFNTFVNIAIKWCGEIQFQWKWSLPNKNALPKIKKRSMEQPDFVSFHLIGLKKFPFSMLPQKKWKERNILWLMWGKTKTETPKRYFEIHWEGQTMSKHLSFRSSTPFLLFFTRGGTVQAPEKVKHVIFCGTAYKNHTPYWVKS